MLHPGGNGILIESWLTGGVGGTNIITTPCPARSHGAAVTGPHFVASFVLGEWMGFQTPLYELSDYLKWTRSGKVQLPDF